MDSQMKLFSNMLYGKIISILGKRKAITIDTRVRSEDLEIIAKLVEEKKLKSIIGRMYDFESTPAAFSHLASRRTQGKIVIKI